MTGVYAAQDPGSNPWSNFCGAANAGKAEEKQTTIELYEHPDYQGKKLVLTAGKRAKDLKADDFNDIISSAKVIGPDFCKWRLYKNTNNRGVFDEIGPGDYRQINDFLKKVGDNAVSSVAPLCGEAWKCPCKNGGWCPLADQKKSICRCPDRWMGKTCEASRKGGICKAQGDPHYYTYDGQKIDYMGTETYTLTKVKDTVADLPYFHVKVKNYKKKSTDRPSYTRYTQVELALNREVNGVVTKQVTTIRMGPDTQFKVNGQNKKLPYEAVPGVHVYKQSGSEIALISDFGLSVDWKMHRVVVKVPSAYKGKMEGICGNMNGDKNDDFVTKEGTDVAKLTKSKRDVEIGDSWVVTEDPSAPPPVKAEEVVMPVATPAELADLEQPTKCGLLKKRDDIANPFNQCYDGLAAEGIQINEIDGCMEDGLLITDSKDDMCATLEGMVKTCKTHGYKVDPAWRIVANCPMVCEGGRVYTISAPACEATCANPDAPLTCQQEPDEGCACPAGQVVNANDQCVEAGACSDCVDRLGELHAGNEQFWVAGDCSFFGTCSNKQEVELDVYGCLPGQICSANAEGQPTCITPPTPAPAVEVPLDRK